jgi:hypothetical protein
VSAFSTGYSKAVTSNDAIPDREELRLSGDRRTRRGRGVLIAVMVALLVLMPVVLLLADHGAHPVGRIVLFGLIPAAVFIAVVLPMTWWVRGRRPHWQTPPLAAGATRDTRRAVGRAIRTGHAPDARVEALAREQAEKTVRNTVALKIYAVLFALQLALLGLRIVNGGPADALVLAVIGDALWAAAVGALVVNLARSRRYLREHPLQNRPL